jgi:4-diphosphocytidyl-2-C-methyl-D-erythritol kinase
MCTFTDRICRQRNSVRRCGIVNNRMIVFPNAKINIGLRILRRRGDGYHDLESIFYPVGLRDLLEILPADATLNDEKPAIYVSGLEVPATGENLCWKAVELFTARQGTPPVRLHLHKRIPVGSGLGGGSSDASFTLLALNEMFGCALDSDVLEGYASELGSDCPFFIRNRPSLVSGRGNLLEPVPLSLAGHYLVIVFPGISVHTGPAYHMIRPSEEGPGLREIPLLQPGQWRSRAGNRFEEPVFAEYPELASIKDNLYRSGAAYASMSGSGSAIYGIFPSPPLLRPELEKYSTYTEKLVRSSGE